jgi:nucleoside phosphorylase
METKNIYQKLHEAKLEIGKVAKNAKNPHFKNTYADLNALIEAVEPILLEKGLVLLQPIKEGRVFTIITSIEDSNSIESYIDLTPGLTAQALGSQITYFRRYTLSSLLTLQAIDDDGQQASQPVKPQKKECDDKTFEVVKKAILDGKKTVEQAKEVFIFTGTQNIELLNLKK